MRHTLALLCFTLALSGHAATIRNDDTCDIAALPAATLLLPYFEVDLNTAPVYARTTLFSVINTTAVPRLVRATIWTDWAYPVYSFAASLTGYDAESFNLRDVLAARATPFEEVRSALTTGRISSCGTKHVGGTHTNAIGYVTIDLVAKESGAMPNEAAYYDDLLYDNVLTGDWQIINPDPVKGNYASADPLVHIRAIPSGGPAGVVTQTNLPYTFYDRYTPHQDRDTTRMDRRQPLPATFGARYIQGGTGAFNTDFYIWREGVIGNGASCSDYATNKGDAMRVLDEVRFDEHENPTMLVSTVRILVPSIYVDLPAASSTTTSDIIFPPLSSSGDVSGWMYLNLTNSRTTRPSQNWVVVSMAAEGRYQTAFSATPLGNGCSPIRAVTDAPGKTNPIGPPPNTNP